MSLIVAYGVLHPSVLIMDLAVAGTIALLLCPPELTFVMAILAFNAAFSFIPGIGLTVTSYLLGAALCTLLALRLLVNDVRRQQFTVVVFVLGFLALETVNAMSLRGERDLTALVAEGAVFGGALLFLAPLPGQAGLRALRWLAFSAALLSGLYVLTAVTGVPLSPGVSVTLPTDAFGLTIDRVYAPGGVLFPFGLLWATAHLSAGGPRSRFAPIVLAVCGLAVASTFSRTVLVASLIAATVTVLMARPRIGRKGQRAATSLLIVLGVIAAIGAGNRLTAGVQEVTNTSGNFGFRVTQVQERSSVIADRPFFGVGFLPGPEKGLDPYTFSDSGLFTIVAHFGFLGLLLLLSLFAVAVRTSLHLRRMGPEPRLVGAVSTGLIAFMIVSAPTIDAISGAGGVAVLCGTLTVLFALNSRIPSAA